MDFQLHSFLTDSSIRRQGNIGGNDPNGDDLDDRADNANVVSALEAL